jgi:N-dimethylarginine dimethylaminohydrolase
VAVHHDPASDGITHRIARALEATDKTATPWGVDSEYGQLLDVLLCPPDNFHWLPASAIARATLASGISFSKEDARRQHAEMVSVYEEAGVRVHLLEPDPALPYQVFARDSSINVPQGPIVTQCHQWWRRGEYAPVIRFYQEAGIPIFGMITAAALEGGDVIIVEPGRMLIGNGEERTEAPAARQLAGWMEELGWEVRIEMIPSQFVHIDVLVSILAPKLAAVCVDVAGAGLVRWLRESGFEILEVPVEEAFALGVNAISLGDDRTLSSEYSKSLNEQLRARGIEVLDPDLSMFTLGGGGAHCLGQALRRERVA